MNQRKIANLLGLLLLATMLLSACASPAVVTQAPQPPSRRRLPNHRRQHRQHRPSLPRPRLKPSRLPPLAKRS